MSEQTDQQSLNQRMATEIDYSRLPEGLRTGVRRYVENGAPVGHFLKACLHNSLVDAVGRADEINREKLVEIIQFLWNELPMECWGSEDKVKRWIAKGGLLGGEAGQDLSEGKK